MKSVLCLDRDQALQASISGYLKDEGYVVFSTDSAACARDIVKKEHPNIVLLELVLGKSSGLDFLRNMASEYPSIPVIMISNRAEEVDRIIGLEAGADDYMGKPFNPRELSARIRTILKRCQNHQSFETHTSQFLSFGNWVMDPQNYEVYDKDTRRSANLTTKEFLVLKELITNPRRVLTRGQLFKLFRDEADDIYDRVVDIQISRIRSKLADKAKDPIYIRTIRDVGYMFIAETSNTLQRHDAPYSIS